MIFLGNLTTRHHTGDSADCAAFGLRPVAGHLAADNSAGDTANNRTGVRRFLTLFLTFNFRFSSRGTRLSGVPICIGAIKRRVVHGRRLDELSINHRSVGAALRGAGREAGCNRKRAYNARTLHQNRTHDCLRFMSVDVEMDDDPTGSIRRAMRHCGTPLT